MAEEIKGLIEKIRQEGIEAAEKKAREIEQEAAKKAEQIIAEAKKQYESLISKAGEKAKKDELAAKSSLQQAGRDLLISLRKQILSMLDKVVLEQVSRALNPEELAKILTTIIREQKEKPTQEIIISLKKEDAETLQKHFFSSLKEEAKKGIVLRPSEEIRAGFMISFDRGKSHFDFTDQALAEYITKYLKPKLSELLNSISQVK
ncbi:MAG: V-type ATP synthase subunit E family protein [Candidatus Omnitrophica bacterium]|nr:V-type ATP synthase subunit E family protein [Candidatus Omnitrophota bacterium]MDD5237819.1 V-type ATP synthase subunit E family protein [Candidatus Omnitrophota bacterium]